MCGIIVTENNVDISKCVQSLLHRGPDSQTVFSDEKIKMGHARLAVRGQENGTQPFVSDASVVVVNGELYDYEKLRLSLERLGRTFTTDSDCELVLHLWELYGFEMFDYLRGEFAFVIYDRKNEQLVFAVDRFSVKPLYFKHGTLLSVASEPRGLEACGTSLNLSSRAVYETITHQYLYGSKTLYEDVEKVSPGSFYVYNLNSKALFESKYWDIPRQERTSMCAETAECILRESIEDAVKVRLNTETNIGVYLSSGIDSATIVDVALRNLGGKKLKAFTVAFKQDSYDESFLTKQLCDDMGVELYILNLAEVDILESFEEAVLATESTAINGQLVGKFLLSKAAKEKNQTVILSGEGSDELLYGYAHLRQEVYENVLTDETQRGIMFDDSVKKLWPFWLEAKFKTGNIGYSLLKKDHQVFSTESLAGRLYDATSKYDSVEQAAYSWSKTALSNYIISTLGDRCEMAHSIEGRPPFLDHKLVEAVKAIPMEYLMSEKTDKPLLRKISTLPSYITKKAKHPFIAQPSLFTPGSDVYVNDWLGIPSEYFDNVKLKKLYKKGVENSEIQQRIEPVLFNAFSIKILENKRRNL